jgi:putative transposase
MPRTSRMIIADEKAVYHVMSRTALDGFPLKDVEKDFMLGLIKSLSEFMREIKVGFARYYNRRHKSS